MFSLSQTQNSLTVAWDGQQVLGYHFPEDGNRPFCHPLNLPGAPPLTMNDPAITSTIKVYGWRGKR